MARPKIHDDALRTRLIDIAAQVLSEQGPHAITLRAVAAEAGTSTSAIYSLFGNKGELLRALYHEGFRRLAQHLAAVPALASGDHPLVRLGALGDAYFTNALEQPHLYGLMFGPPLPELCATNDDLAFALATLQTLIDAVGDCVDAGFITGPADEAAMQIWSAEHGLASLAIAGMLGPPEQARSFARAAEQTMVKGLMHPDRVVSDVRSVHAASVYAARANAVRANR